MSQPAISLAFLLISYVRLQQFYVHLAVTISLQLVQSAVDFFAKPGGRSGAGRALRSTRPPTPPPALPSDNFSPMELAPDDQELEDSSKYRRTVGHISESASIDARVTNRCPPVRVHSRQDVISWRP